jgi:hypothetical protein
MSTTTAATVRKALPPIRTGTDGDRSIRSAAVVAGISLLVMTALAVFANFVVLEALITPGDAARTTTDLLASKGLFQLGIVGWVLIAALDVIVSWALFRVFPVGQRLAIAAASARLIYTGILGLAIAQLVGALRLLNDQASSVGSSAALQAHVLQKAEAFTDVYDAGLFLFGIHLMLIGYLAYRSGYVPRILGALVGIAGLGYVLDSVAVALSLDLSFKISVVTGMGELVLAFWLVIRGRRVTLPESNVPQAVMPVLASA